MLSATGSRPKPLSNPLKISRSTREFEAAILAEYLPQTPVEQELVRRLASLFWRLRRATSIETGLLRMQGEILQAFRSCREKSLQSGEGEGAGAFADYRQGPLADAQAAHVPDPEIRPAPHEFSSSQHRRQPAERLQKSRPQYPGGKDYPE